MAHCCHLNTTLAHWTGPLSFTLALMRMGELLGGEIEYNLLFKPICLLSALGPYRENIKLNIFRTFDYAKLVFFLSQCDYQLTTCNLKAIVDNL